MTRDEMVAALQAMGFKRQSTVSAKWKGALFHSNGGKTMLVLVRTRGVDVLVSTLTRDEMSTADGLLRVSSQRPGDNFGDFCYTDSPVDIHTHVVALAELFLKNEPIPGEYFSKLGIGRSQWARTYGNNSHRSPAAQARSEMQEIYEAACGADGEPAYLGDGVWVTAGGSLEDRGR